MAGMGVDIDMNGGLLTEEDGDLVRHQSPTVMVLLGILLIGLGYIWAIAIGELNMSMMLLVVLGVCVLLTTLILSTITHFQEHGRSR